jgi:Helicase conserved C-terminal domain
VTVRDRAWLRGFLRLDARAGTAVRARDVERQEDTVLRALAMLDEQPGVVLADEVGMGKTYEALGVLAARLHERPDGRSLILTPGPDLNTKWTKDLRGFCDANRTMFAGFAGRFEPADSLAKLVQCLARSHVVVAPVTVFIGGRASADLAYLLSLWGEARELAGNQLAAIFRRYRDGKLERVQVTKELFLDAFPWPAIKPHLADILRDHARGEASLDAMWEMAGYEAFEHKDAIDRALADLRFRIIGRMLPPIDLLVVDEAHKLKSSDSVRTTGVRTAFGGRFERALFLTATPFQLTVSELRQVFALFALARSAPADLMDQADHLLAEVDEYTAAYEQFERVWARADGVVAADFAGWFAQDPGLATDPDDVVLRPIVAAARRLLALKRDKIEPSFRRWMIRSLREDKRVYRRNNRLRLRAQGPAGVPFLLYERFIAELFRSGTRTHKAAVQINMVSSFGAAREGALLADGPADRLEGDAEAYRRLLQEVVGQLRSEAGGHPKIGHVVSDALAAVDRDEKTLIFCARVETLRELKRQIETAWEQKVLERWRRAYPGASHNDVFEHEVDGKRVDGHHSRLRDRFSRAQDALYLALRERYVSTLLDGWTPTPAQLEQLVTSANVILQRQLVGRTQAERFDWSLAKRCVEQAAALMVRDLGLDRDIDEQALTQLTDPRFVALGYDLEKDDVEDFAIGDATPSWAIDLEDAKLILRREHLWAYLAGPLHNVPPELRVRTVERLASYLVARNVPFLPDLLEFAHAEGVDLERIESRALLPVIDRFWTTATGRPWCDLLRRFLTYADTLDDEHRREVLDDAVRAGDLVRHTVDGESRERLREAFNTPLFPMVLVANEVMQEGLDLHHHCRRVVHHDLAWNPAQLEQRVGRVDRLGSLVQRLRDRKPETTLDVLLPLIANTIDERLDRAVRLRERWLEFLLGAAPRIDEYGLADEPAHPLPLAFAAALRVELGPAHAIV